MEIARMNEEEKQVILQVGKRFEQVDRRLDRRDKKFNRMTGILVTLFVALMGGMITMITRVMLLG